MFVMKDGSSAWIRPRVSSPGMSVEVGNVMS